MSRLNFHHLHYFWAVAKDGNLTRTAARLHVSQSALSAQIKLLERDLGHALFTRGGRQLRLTEVGRLVLGYAETIFTTGVELQSLLRDGQHEHRQVVRIGAVATLSRNFQENFVRPLLGRDDVELSLHSGGLAELLARLRVHSLDLVLSNRRVHAAGEEPWRCRRIARQPVSLVGRPRSRRQRFRYPDDLATVSLLVPGRDSDIRAAFDLSSRQGAAACGMQSNTGDVTVQRLRCRLRAEVDDMAMMRLLARDSDSVALLPSVVVQDELRAGVLVEYAVVPDLFETFYAITVQRHFTPPLLRSLLDRPEEDVLEPRARARKGRSVTA